MRAKNKRDKLSHTVRSKRLTHEAEGTASGALVGAVVGSAAGPPGLVAGALVGGVAGALTGAALDDEASRQAARTRELDAQIGVSGGELGASHLAHPPPELGAYSPSSAGASRDSSETTAEGPIQAPPD